MTYDKYFTMLQTACMRYDKSLKQKPSSTARAVYQHGLDGDSGTDGEDGDYIEEGLALDGIDTPSDDLYNINATNFNRNPQVKSLIPRTPKGKQKPIKVASNKPRYHGPVYLTEFGQPIQVQSHLEMSGILVQLGCIQRTKKLAPQIDPKWSPTWSLRRHQAIFPLSARDGRYVYRISRAHRMHNHP